MSRVMVKENIKVRKLTITYPRKLDMFPVFRRAIEQADFYQGLISGPEKAIIGRGSADRSASTFLVAEDYADKLVAELSAL